MDWLLYCICAFRFEVSVDCSKTCVQPEPNREEIAMLKRDVKDAEEIANAACLKQHLHDRISASSGALEAATKATTPFAILMIAAAIGAGVGGTILTKFLEILMR